MLWRPAIKKPNEDGVCTCAGFLLGDLLPTRKPRHLCTSREGSADYAVLPHTAKLRCKMQEAQASKLVQTALCSKPAIPHLSRDWARRAKCEYLTSATSAPLSACAGPM